MTPDEIVAKADELKQEATGIPAISFSNYKYELDTYKQILNDVLVLIRETNCNIVQVAKAAAVISPLQHAAASITPPQPKE